MIAYKGMQVLENYTGFTYHKGRGKAGPTLFDIPMGHAFFPWTPPGHA